MPRIIRLMLLKDKSECKRELEEVAALPGLERVVVAHGDWLIDNPSAQLREVARAL